MSRAKEFETSTNFHSNPDNSPVIITPKDVADLLGVNIKTVYGMVDRNEIPHRRAGRKILFCRETVLDWLRGGQSRVSKLIGGR